MILDMAQVSRFSGLILNSKSGGYFLAADITYGSSVDDALDV